MPRLPEGEPRFVEVVRQIQWGDAELFSELVASFQDMAVGYAYSILGDFQLAEDAAQEAFLDAYRHLLELREPLAFPSWLRRIVFKHCDRRTRKWAPDTVPIEDAGEAETSILRPDELAERNEMRVQLSRALEALPEKQRSVLVLHYMSGHSLVEMSAFLNVPVGTVKKRLHDARAKLREILVDDVTEGLRVRRPSRDSAFADAVVEMLHAARSGDKERVKTLLLKNPRLRHGRDVMGNTALIVAVNSGQTEVAALLRAAGAPVDHHEAAAIGDVELLTSLLDERPQILDAFSEEGFTALALASHFGHLDAARLLIARGANVNLVSRHPIGVTPLIAALFGRQVETALLLLEHGADVTSRRGGPPGPRTGWTPLHYAAACGFEEVLRELLERGADENIRDASGHTARDVAQIAGQKEAERFLTKEE